jgi:hypothetical protein
MPIAYEIDRRRGVIITTWAGPVTAQDLASHWKVLFSDPEAMQLRKSLADLRKSELQFKGTDLAGLLRTLVQPRLGKQKWTTALLVEHATQFGVARQYNVYAAPFSHDRIFHNSDLAMQWLGEQGPPD